MALEDRSGTVVMKKIHGVTIGVAIVWAAVILAVAKVLQGIPQGKIVITLVGGGIAATLILLGSLRRP